MTFHGKIVGNEIKDMGKGKDAEAQEQLLVTVKLDPKSGGSHRGRIQLYVPLEEAGEYQLGDLATLNFEIRQQKLGLEGARRAGAAKHRGP